MHQASDGKVAGVAIFFEGGQRQRHYSAAFMPNTPGKEQEVVGVEVNPGGLLPRLGHAGAASFAVQEVLWPFAQFSSPA
jgi:hypothetical protein